MSFMDCKIGRGRWLRVPEGWTTFLYDGWRSLGAYRPP